MATYRASVDWSLEAGGDFLKGRYSRGHTVAFGSGQTVAGTASPHVVGNRWAVEGSADPEEMLVASLSACHMLTFLHVARVAGFVAAAYRDAAEGTMAKNDVGKLAVTRVVLRPTITWTGPEPTAAELAHLHHEAHEGCFIASSVKAEVVVEAP